jgi:hypothetical protein
VELEEALYNQVLNSYQIVLKLSQDFPVNNNPFKMIIGPLLTEQSAILGDLLSLLQNDTLPKQSIREAISILYRSNEAFDPTYQAWIRASKWMDATNSHILQQKKNLAKELRDSLKATVPSIKRIFGEDETRYIVPPLFRFHSR